MTNRKPKIHIVTLHDEKYLPQVLQLHKANKAWLGPLPDQAFKNSMRNGELFAALENDSVVGYLCGSLASRRFRIIHLTVRAEYRGKGIAKQLIKRARDSFSHTRGLQATCRRDYENADKLWAGEGFIPIGQKPGRGRDGKTLTRWWLPLTDELDLFSASLADQDVLVAVDTSVVSNLAREKREEYSKILLSHDAYDFTLCLLPCVSKELAAAPKDETQLAIQNMVQMMGFAQLKTDAHDMKRDLLSMVDPKYIRKDQSLDNDAEIVAEAIMAGCKILLTSDNGMIGALSRSADRYGLTIAYPENLDVAMEKLENRLLYAPGKLNGTNLTIATQSFTDWNPDSLADLINTGASETRQEFKNRVNEATREVNGKKSVFRVLKDADGNVLAAWNIRETSSKDSRKINFFRVKHGETELTIARAVLWSVRLEAIRKKVSIVHFDNTCLSNATIEALEYQGAFIDPSATPPCFTLRIVDQVTTADELEKLLPDNYVSDQEFTTAEDYVFSAEHDFFPLKVRGSGIETYMVPINPEFATDLLNHRETLFSLSNDLGLSPELVYYRSPYEQPTHSRILWYVSDPEQAIFGCSQLLNLEIGNPVQIFRKYARFGVFNEEQVTSASSKGKVAALRFRDTEIFSNPVSLEAIRRILGKLNPRLQQATKITEEQFFHIYKYGREGGSQ